jgi:2-polyprenyl-3-methyl-5-hydroxy-6-metoxy-1,4-benzoquinol methylase
MPSPKTEVQEAARTFTRFLQETERELRRCAAAIPTSALKTECAAQFWSFMDAINRVDSRNLNGEAAALREECRAIVGPWLFRSRYFNRSFHKPHGYAGDFRLIEWMYDLEDDLCEDTTQPAFVNCLDYLFSTVHSVRSVWERRHWFAALFEKEYQRNGGRLRILDVACGGSCYIRDFLSRRQDTSGIEITLVDQDPAALAYCRTESLRPWLSQLRMLSVPIKRLPAALPEGAFDVVVSAGLFDYLDAQQGRSLLAHLAALTVPGGVTAIANFHRDDPSRTVKEWLVDWPLVLRDETELAALFPVPSSVQTLQTENKSLVYAVARREQPKLQTPLNTMNDGRHGGREAQHG